MWKRFLPVAALPLFAVAACSTPSAEETAPSSSQAVESLPNDKSWAVGTNWQYKTNFVGLPHAWVYTPKTFSKKAPNKRGVVFHLVGCGELPYQVAEGSGWPEVAEAYGLVVVVPEVIDPLYPNLAAPNVGCYDFGTTAVTQPTKYSTDHAALIAAGQKIVHNADLAIDPRQVYIAGLSAGATVAMQVACMAPDVFAGVGSVAGPSLGTWQMAEVMPPVWDSTMIRWGCNYYAEDNDDADKAKAALAQQIYAIASDDNGLPAGIPIMVGGVWTATEFADQEYWDGDKYVPFAHHRLIADAMAPVFGASLTAEDQPLTGPGMSGIGYGCADGAKSHDDTDEVKCPVSAYVKRPWQVKADIWTDKQGRQRIVHLKQDTLRHRWPVGPMGPLDRPVTPSFATLVSEGYMTAHAEVDEVKSASAPSGTFGVGFFGDDTFNFAAYLAQYFNDNNPRL
jgi:poly(hydroxyalkanoate) depolymerase family esterase